MFAKRIQLTMFLEEKESFLMEKIRMEFNPLQFQLIKSHITICRGEELVKKDKVLQNLQQLKCKPITLQLSKLKRFADGKGVLIPVQDLNNELQNLRKHLLQGAVENPKQLEAHITLIHPRNGTCTDAIFEKIKLLDLPTQCSIHTISLIEQWNGEKWEIKKEFIPK